MASRRISRQEEELIVMLNCPVGARQGLIWLYTMEEKRASSLLQCVAKTCKRKLRLWRCTSGMHDVTGKMFDGTVLPLDALNFAAREKDRFIYVFLDLPDQMIVHPGTQGTVVLRKLKDVAMELATGQSSLFVVTSNPAPPKEIEDLAYKLDLPLPDAETIKTNLLQELARRGRLDLDTAGMSAFAEVLLGTTLQKAEDILAREIQKHGRLTTSRLASISRARKELIEGVSGLEFIDLDGQLPELGGMSYFKEWLRLRRAAFTEAGRRAGLEPPRGVIFVGPPGVGKSLAAKVAAVILGLVLLRLNMGAVFNKYVGESEANLRRLQSVVDAFSSSELWIDEIEKGLPSSSGDTDGGTSSRVLAELLTWGQERTGKVFFVATANDVEALRPEILRVGRFFDAIFFMDLPTTGERKEIFRIHLARRNRKAEEFDLDVLSDASRGYTGAEIEEAIRSALYIAFTAKQDLNTEHLLRALEEIRPISKTMETKIERIRGWGRRYARPAGDEKENFDDE